MTNLEISITVGTVKCEPNVLVDKVNAATTKDILVLIVITIMRFWRVARTMLRVLKVIFSMFNLVPLC